MRFRIRGVRSPDNSRILMGRIQMRRELRIRLSLVAALFALFGYSATSLAASGAFETTVAIDGDAIIDISNDRGTVLVTGGDVDEVTVRARITIDKRYARTDPQKAGRLISMIKRSPPVEAVGNHVTIGKLEKHTLRRYATINYEIVVPRDAAVNVHTVSGDVRVSGISGEVKATSDTGKVTVANLDTESSAPSSS